MNIGDRELLMEHIRQIRRSVVASTRAASTDAAQPQPDRIESLETRVAHLEQLLEGLQDSVHRESERHATLIAELQAQVEPSTMGAAMAEDARKRGL